MSHNKITVGGQEPNREGAVSLALDNLSNVSASSPSAGQTIAYNGANWVLGDKSVSLAVFGTGATQAYPTGGSAIASGVDLHFYGVQYNGVGATVGAAWFDTFTLPAGNYTLTAVSGVTMSASGGIVTYRWYDQTNTTLVGTTGNVGFETDTVGSPAVAYLSLTSSAVLSVHCITASNVNTLASQGNRAAEYGFITIRRLS